MSGYLYGESFGSSQIFSNINTPTFSQPGHLYEKRFGSSQTFSSINTPTFFQPGHLYEKRFGLSQTFSNINTPTFFQPGHLYEKRFGSSQTFSHINTPTFSKLVILRTYLPMKMDQTECSEMSAYNIQTPGNYPEESTQQFSHCMKPKIGTHYPGVSQADDDVSLSLCVLLGFDP
jgi:hypothetical protein